MLKLQDIRRLHIELTTRCNARCPMCMRNYRGTEFNSGYPITELSLANIQHILPPEFLTQIQRINLNGNLGDFGLARDAHAIVTYLLENSSAEIQIETNGGMRTPDWWTLLAKQRVVIMFALDGMSDVHHLYRQDTDWHRVIANATAFINAGGYAVWKFIPFDHNRHQIDQCRQLSRELGFRDFVIYDQGRDRGPVFERDGEFSHWLGPSEDWQPESKAMIEQHITWFKPDGEFPWIPDQKADINCISKNDREIYIAADGSIYPCCYLGFYPKTMHHPGNIQFRDWVTKNNALEWDLDTCLRWFAQVEASWQAESIKSGRLFTCVQSCGSVNKR